MAHADASGERKYRYKLRLTVEQTDISRPSILVNKHKLYEADSVQSPEIRALANYSREHLQLADKDLYILAFSLMTARQMLAQATHASSKFDDLRACLDGIERDMSAGDVKA
jgi:hypothetical protein